MFPTSLQDPKAVRSPCHIAEWDVKGSIHIVIAGQGQVLVMEKHKYSDEKEGQPSIVYVVNISIVAHLLCESALTHSVHNK